MPVTPTSRVARAAFALTAASLLALTGCTQLREAIPTPSGGPTTSSPSAQPTPGAEVLGTSVVPDGTEMAQVGQSAAQLDSDPAQDPAYSAFYDQDITWGPCEDASLTTPGVECAELTVPLAWNEPDGQTLDLALVRLPASGESRGNLVTNPGGPGGSGVDFVGLNGGVIGTEQLRSAYDLVGFDPRGVSRSEGFLCYPDTERDETEAEPPVDPTKEGAVEGTRMQMDEYGKNCAQQAGDLLGLVDTMSAARDMDVLRAALGDEKLSYLGYSYGTYLGATYAELYPQRVGRMVLDAAIAPRIGMDDLVAGQAQGFEESITEFLRSCLEDNPDSCPFDGDLDAAREQLTTFFEQLDADPLSTNDPNRRLSGEQARTAVMLLQYNQGNWQYGYTVLASAMNDGDGSGLLALADAAVERQPDGSYRGNSADAIIAINCLDHPWATDEDFQLEEARRLAEAYPVLGDQFGLAGAGCSAWPEAPVREPGPITAKGSDLIVVVGTTHDPATPYRWAQSMEADLDNGTLITRDGYGHTAYGSSGGCVEEAVDAYLIDGVAPEEGLTC